MSHRLAVFQSLWATERRIPGQAEEPISARLDAIEQAGFDGVVIDLGSMDLATVQAHIAVFRASPLRKLLTAFPRTIEDLRPQIALGRALDVPFLVVVGQVMPLQTAAMAEVVRRWLEIGEQECVPLHFETHRDSITNDLFATMQIIEAVPELRLCADLSHYVVDREMSLPVADNIEAMIDLLLDRCDSFQIRIATGQHIQVPLAFPQHRPWLELQMGWLARGFGKWRERQRASDAELILVTELGPTEYAITDHSGLELSDRHQEALMLRAMAHHLWNGTDVREAVSLVTEPS